MVASAKLKFDQITVWENGKGGADGKGSTADFVSGLVSLGKINNMPTVLRVGAYRFHFYSHQAILIEKYHEHRNRQR